MLEFACKIPFINKKTAKGRMGALGIVGDVPDLLEGHFDAIFGKPMQVPRTVVPHVSSAFHTPRP